jgi:RNA polymerase sigma-70 factor, ECF subfamily
LRPSHQTASSPELVRLAREGDPEAFGALIERHIGAVTSVALARLRDRDTAEDLAQEVFLRAQLHLDQLTDPERFGGWVCRMARNLAIDWLRRGQSASRLVPLVPLDAMATEIPDVDAKGARETMEMREQSHTVHEAIMRLPVEQREAVLLHFTEGMTQQQIAEHLGTHQATVSRRLQRALKALRGVLEPMLREATASLRPSRSTVAKSVALAAAVSAMSGSAKASLVASATVGSLASAAEAAQVGAVGAAGLIGLVKSLPALIAGGGKAMATGKGIAATVAAVAAIGGGSFVALHEGSPERSAVPADVRSVYPYTCTMIMMQDQTLLDSLEIEALAPGRWREIRANRISVWDTAGRPGRMLNLDPQRRTAIEQTLGARAGNVITDFLSDFPQMRVNAQESLGRQQVDGRSADVWRGRTSATLDSVDWTWVTTLSVDPGTHLPIRIEQVQTGRGVERRHTWSDFVYHANVDESLFSMTPPEGYEVAISEPAPSPSPIPPTEGVFAVGSEGEMIALSEFAGGEIERLENRMRAGENPMAIMRELNLPSVPRDTRLIINRPRTTWERNPETGIIRRTYDVDQYVPVDRATSSLGGSWREVPGAVDIWEVTFLNPVRGDVLVLTCEPLDPSAAGVWLARFEGPVTESDRLSRPPVRSSNAHPIAEIVQVERGLSPPIPVGRGRRVRVICPPGFGGLEEIHITLQQNMISFDLQREGDTQSPATRMPAGAPALHQSPIEGTGYGSLQFTLLEEGSFLCLAKGEYTYGGLTLWLLFEESSAFADGVVDLNSRQNRGELNEGQWEYQRDLLIQSLWPELEWQPSALTWYDHHHLDPELACRALFCLAISGDSGLPVSLFFTPEQLEELAQTDPSLRDLPPAEELWESRHEAIGQLARDLGGMARAEYGSMIQATPGPGGSRSLVDVHVDVWVDGVPRTMFIPRMIRLDGNWGFIEGPTLRDQGTVVR